MFFSFITVFFSSNSGTLVTNIGFEWMLVGIAILCFIYAPLLTFLRAPPTKEEKKVGVEADGGISNGGICNKGLTLDNNELAFVNGAQNCITKL